MLQKTTKSTGCLVRIGQIAVSIIVLVVLGLFAGAFYQQSAAARDREAYVLSDNLFTVDGIEMHILCKGTGSLTVVFESGAGTPYLNWWEIQAAISQNVRTCVYDRQNSGWSGYTGATPTPNAVARTLHSLLENAGESAPYILVGHSLGGVYVREYATLYPDDVVGMVQGFCKVRDSERETIRVGLSLQTQTEFWSLPHDRYYTHYSICTAGKRILLLRTELTKLS